MVRTGGSFKAKWKISVDNKRNDSTDLQMFFIIYRDL